MRYIARVTAQGLDLFLESLENIDGKVKYVDYRMKVGIDLPDDNLDDEIEKDQLVIGEIICQAE